MHSSIQAEVHNHRLTEFLTRSKKQFWYRTILDTVPSINFEQKLAQFIEITK